MRLCTIQLKSAAVSIGSAAVSTRRDDYGRPLAREDVVRRAADVEDVNAWRAEIRRQARADRIKVRTGANEHVVYAFIAGGLTAERHAQERRYSELLAHAVPRAVERRHEPSILVRDGDEIVCRCDRCPSLGYAHATDDVVGGELFEDECSHEGPPALTNLALMYCGRQRES